MLFGVVCFSNDNNLYPDDVLHVWYPFQVFDDGLYFFGVVNVKHNSTFKYTINRLYGKFADIRIKELRDNLCDLVKNTDAVKSI